MTTSQPLPIAVFASGGGTNLQALIDRFNAVGSRSARVALVVSDRDDAGALLRAGKAGIPRRVIATRGRDLAAIGADMLDVLAAHDIGLVALAGYLKLVPPDVVRAYRERMVNVHPALLPSFGGPGFYGMRVHEAVIESGVTVTGPTVHLVDEDYDRGRILAQWPVPVLPGDTADAVAARVLAVEHVLYPAVIETIAGGTMPTRSRLRRHSDAADAAASSAFALALRPPTIDEVRSALQHWT